MTPLAAGLRAGLHDRAREPFSPARVVSSQRGLALGVHGGVLGGGRRALQLAEPLEGHLDEASSGVGIAPAWASWCAPAPARIPGTRSRCREPPREA